MATVLLEPFSLERAAPHWQADPVSRSGYDQVLPEAGNVNMTQQVAATARTGMQIRVRGLVQGVGFRPKVWSLARECGITGSVINDAAGVLIEAWGNMPQLQKFLEGLAAPGLPLARLDSVESRSLPGESPPSTFEILASIPGDADTAVAADAASCPACIEESLNPLQRRYRYPFTNCTHCGPRLTIIKSIPYDRANTSMGDFTLCKHCRTEYEDPQDRRYHAEPTACPACGPKVQLWTTVIEGGSVKRRAPQEQLEVQEQLDPLAAAAAMLAAGKIVAIKALGGFNLCCDATNDSAVQRLREGKNRRDKPLAMMAADIAVINQYCHVSPQEELLLKSQEAPIVVLEARAQHRLSAAVAPGVKTLGFMLPHTPLQHLLLSRFKRPIVCTSGNLSDEPQCTDSTQVQERLSGLADYVLDHDRAIINRVDDSLIRLIAGEGRLIRRARGYAPAPMPLPPGFASTPSILAMGGELKNTLCFLKNDRAVLSQHIGDLKDPRTFEDYKKNLELYQSLFQHKASCIAVDMHPDYLSTKLGKAIAAEKDLELIEIQHHHAHLAACLAENQRPLDAEVVLGVVLDGLGYGDGGSFWGGEFMLADYAGFKRLASFKPVALPGGAQAILEPWRNTYAQIMAALGWTDYKMNFAELELTAFLESKPLELLASMLKSGTNVPLASSCGRLFDAVAAAIGICRERASYEGQAAMELESIVDTHELLQDDSEAYPFSISIPGVEGISLIEAEPMWRAILADLSLKTPAPIMAARFHKGLALVIVKMIGSLCKRAAEPRVDTVALSGGVFQNKILLEEVKRRLEQEQFRVLTQRHVPSNDGGIALGQALISAAKLASKRISDREISAGQSSGKQIADAQASGTPTPTSKEY